MSEPILCEIRDAVATLTLNRAERLNALDRTMREALTRELARLDADDGVRCVVLTGSRRAFSSGADLDEDGAAPHRGDVLDWYRFLEGTRPGDAPFDASRLHKPVIAAVSGHCYGLGMILAAECDLVVAGESARFGMVEARMGTGGSTVLPFLIGAQWTRYLMYTGETIDAHTAKEIGLVLEVVADDELLPRVHDLAMRVAATPPHQVLFSKRQTDGTLALMGRLANEVFSLPNQAILNSLAQLAESPDGRKLLDILRDEGIAGLKKARDAGRDEPWLR